MALYTNIYIYAETIRKVMRTFEMNAFNKYSRGMSPPAGVKRSLHTQRDRKPFYQITEIIFIHVSFYYYFLDGNKKTEAVLLNKNNLFTVA